ncbi:J domain-containing protein [Sphingomonas sinipercae]|uniref:J domain-containing protein n=1 Tax=Sphingomonas sinipercae TaxID=2714944 RepID=A0A6G7ZMM0_9SPHN|nr:J domain-containing protein [Sphingomonas sinipercae]QIL02183.1 J domain-containing protein [Sphingomonas sinipercae]
MNGSLEAAYAMLGLRPGANRDAVEREYRRLIKEYHPDHAGGDGERAAEINRAYALIRKTPAHPPPVATYPQHSLQRRKLTGLSPFLGLALLIAAVLVGWNVAGNDEVSWTALGASFDGSAANETFINAQPRPGLDEPLATRLIDLAVADAIRLHEAAEPRSMAANSAECLRALRADPSATRFDSCAAFDEAISILETGRAGFQRGPFNAASVSARQVAAGRLLSTDTFAVDSRLQQMRSRVQMTLFPRIPDPPRTEHRKEV